MIGVQMRCKESKSAPRSANLIGAPAATSMMLPSFKRTARAGLSGTSSCEQASRVKVNTGSGGPMVTRVPAGSALLPTVIGICCVWPPAVTEMVAVPNFRGSTSPPWVTLATVGSEVLHWKVGSTGLPEPSVAEAWNCCTMPRASAVGAFKDRFTTGPLGVGGGLLTVIGTGELIGATLPALSMASTISTCGPLENWVESIATEYPESSGAPAKTGTRATSGRG